MVQRKVVNKLGVQAESSKKYTASEKRPTALKPCYQHQDSKNKGGGEMKKKMKKSRSFKFLDIESLRPPPRRDQSRFKKLPAIDESSITASQKKTLLPVKTPDGSPNYMKPTSSSDARKESLHLQVSPQPQTSDKNRSPKNFSCSKPSSGLKPMKVLKRNSSLKPVRPSMKKSYGVGLYHPKLNAGRTTCSSTLKESKFPTYVDLHPEGTELEGTSVLKVCPYTYCSLNGHLHTASPPLKHFLSARRRFLKTQKSMKLKTMSSPRQKNSSKRKKEVDTGQMGFDGDPVLEVYTNFFVEIFAKPREENAESENYSDAKARENAPEFNSSETAEVFKEELSDGDDDEIPPPCSSESTETNMEDDGVVESQSNNTLGQNIGLFIAEMDVSMKFPEDTESEQEVEVWDTDNLAGWIETDQEKTSYECCKETENLREEGMDQDKSVSDATDMDWKEEGAPDFDDGIDYSAFSEGGSVSLTDHAPGNEDSHDLADDPDDSVRANEVLEEAIILQVQKEDAESFITLFEGEDENSMIYEVCGAANGLNHNQPAAAETKSRCQYNEIAVLNTEESDAPNDKQNGTIDSTSFTDFAGDPIEAGDENATKPEQENDFMYEYAPVGDDTEGGLDQPTCATGLRSLEHYPETEQGEVKRHHSSDNQHSDTDLKSPELNGLDDSNDLLKIQISGFFETGQDTANAGHKNTDGEVFQCDDGSINQENRCREEAAIDRSSITTDQVKLGYDYIATSTCFEESDHTEIYGFSSADDCIRTSDKIQLEDKTMVEAEETYAKPNIKSPEKDEAITNAGSDSNKPLPETFSNLKWKTNKVSKRPIENYHLLKKFNPRPPRYLLPEPNPEAEKVDLRHQMMDERKNVEEWMIDYALQQTVTKLIPARKRRVALLVEAFETVMPLPKYEAHPQHPAASYTHARPIQACS